MYKDSKIKLIPRLIVGFITIVHFFYDKTLARYFIFPALIIMGLIELAMKKRQKNQG